MKKCIKSCLYCEDFMSCEDRKIMWAKARQGLPDQPEKQKPEAVLTLSAAQTDEASQNPK